MPSNLSDPQHHDSEQRLAERITAALGTPPSTYIPLDFAARVTANAYARFGPIPQPRPAPQFGATAVRFALAALLLAMLLLARAFPLASPLSVALQATLAAEFLLLALYLVRRHSAQM